jgi:hypothetical protein
MYAYAFSSVRPSRIVRARNLGMNIAEANGYGNVILFHSLLHFLQILRRSPGMDNVDFWLSWVQDRLVRYGYGH